ncbi:MAG TPA: hypothetical protein VHE14_07000, partial [Solirubrobacteraceae bacterium]|nr:hypothetical protein [Solirubrobacteraceae bacterium]
MGLLEDAIKEHLELKRSRGADPDEVEQQASEALGPVRRPQLDDGDAGEPMEAMETVAVQDQPLPAEETLHDDMPLTELPPPDAAV